VVETAAIRTQAAVDTTVVAGSLVAVDMSTVVDRLAAIPVEGSAAFPMYSSLEWLWDSTS